MRIFTRYLLKEVLWHGLIGASVFTFVIFMRELTRILEAVVRNSAPFPSVAEIFFLTLPAALKVTIPMGVLVGILLGLSRMATIWLVIIPQALRIIIPPLSNQMLGLVKDTSIGVAVAFPEFVAISRTVINQTGQALEVMFVVMIFFLLINFSIAFGMNVYNRSIRFSER